MNRCFEGLLAFGLALLLVTFLSGCNYEGPPGNRSAQEEIEGGDEKTDGIQGPEGATHEGAATAKPNIVVVLSDDQRFDTLGVTGHPFIETPHIDRLAEEGALFPNAFVVTSKCRPSRATLLSGRYTHKTGVSDNKARMEPEATLVKRLRGQGYRTAFFGKYHADDCSPRAEFDHWECLEGREGQGEYFDGVLDVNGQKEPFEGYSTDVIAERAARWIEAQGEDPFFALVSLKNPHSPLLPPPRHARLYEDVAIEVPASTGDDLARLPEFVRNRTTARIFMNREDEADLPTILRRYARMIPSIDDAVGRIDAVLGRRGLRDRTLLVFTSDNGMVLGEHGIIRKALAYEPSIRVPLVARFPGRIPAGARPAEAVLNVDLPATFLSAAGAGPEAMASLDGRDVLSLFDPAHDSKPPWREDWVYVAPYRPGTPPAFLASRTPHWKYIRYTGPPVEEELFDMWVDTGERYNRAADPAYQEALDEMRKRLLDGMRALDMPAQWGPPDSEPG